MLFTARVVCLTAASFALVSISTVHGYAIPESLRNIDYRRHDLNVRIIEETSKRTVQTSGPPSDLNQRDSDYVGQIGLINNYYKQANINSNNLS
jgi:hypothetical protein